MEVINVGRASDNDVVINDRYVSRHHCQLIHHDNGSYELVDMSTYGTYVNGRKVNRRQILYRSDIVKLGTTCIPWMIYFRRNGPIDPPSQPPISTPPVSPTPVPGDGDGPSPKQSGLGYVALVLSLIGAGLLMYAAILVYKWSFFALIGRASTLIWLSVGLDVIAYIIACIADKDDEKNDAASTAKAISSTCVIIVIGFFLYCKYGSSIGDATRFMK